MVCTKTKGLLISMVGSKWHHYHQLYLCLDTNKYLKLASLPS